GRTERAALHGLAPFGARGGSRPVPEREPPHGARRHAQQPRLPAAPHRRMVRAALHQASPERKGEGVMATTANSRMVSRRQLLYRIGAAGLAAAAAPLVAAAPAPVQAAVAAPGVAGRPALGRRQPRRGGTLAVGC